MSISNWAWTGSAACTIFWSVIDAWIFCSRIPGSGSSVCSTAAIPDTWLPATVAVASVRTETGTMAISGCAGSSPRAPSHSRSMPPHSASTTSLTVHPAAFLIACASASDVEPNANRRCWLMRWLKTVRGAWLRSWLSIAGTRSRMRGPPLDAAEAVDRLRQRPPLHADQSHRPLHGGVEPAGEHLRLASAPARVATAWPGPDG